MRTAKSCGPDAAVLASSLAELSEGDGGKKADHRGDHEGNRKTIARGMPGDPGVTVVTNARAFYTTRAAAGASSARHSLRPLIGGRDLHSKPRAKRRGEIAKPCLNAVQLRRCRRD